MKRLFYIFVIIIGIAFYNLGLQAQDYDYSGGGYLSGKVLSTSMLVLNPGVLNIEYESASSNRASTAYRGLFGSEKSDDWEWTTMGAGISYRGYSGHTAPDGGYFGLGIDALKVTAKFLGSENSSTFFTPAIEFGYQSVADWGLAFAIGGSLGFTMGDITIGGEKIPLSGMAIGLRLSLGYGW